MSTLKWVSVSRVDDIFRLILMDRNKEFSIGPHLMALPSEDENDFLIHPLHSHLTMRWLMPRLQNQRPMFGVITDATNICIQNRLYVLLNRFVKRAGAINACFVINAWFVRAGSKKNMHFETISKTCVDLFADTKRAMMTDAQVPKHDWSQVNIVLMFKFNARETSKISY